MLPFSVLERLSLEVPRLLWRRRPGAAPCRPIRLLSVHEVADVHKEPGIITGYVPHGSPWLCIRSLFLATNETINFWTHFLAGLYFVWRLAEVCASLELADPFSWPYLCYMLTTCIYPFVSCVAHAFSSMSVKAAHVAFFIDYAAISTFGYGVGVLYRCYCFPASWMGTWYSDCFLYVCFVNTIVCTLLACRSRFMRRGRRQKCVRVLAFLVPFAWDNAPLVYRLWRCDATSCQPSAPFHLRQLAASALGSFFYGTHLPELMSPGSFDIIGHSHNFLHVFGIHATNEQMKGALLDMQVRHAELSGTGVSALAAWATWGCAAAILINVLIVAGSVLAMSRRIDRETQKLR